MRVPLLVTAPRVDQRKASRQEAGPPPAFQYDVRCQPAHLRQQPSVVVYQCPELTGKGERNVLPFAVRHQTQQVLYPDFSGLHPTVRTGAAFTAETDFFVWPHPGSEQRQQV